MTERCARDQGPCFERPAMLHHKKTTTKDTHKHTLAHTITQANAEICLGVKRIVTKETGRR